MHLIARAGSVGLLLVCAGAEAQVQEEIRRCASIGVDAERLACYDRLFRDSSAQSRAPAATAAGAASGAAAAGAAQAGAGAAPAGAGASGGAAAASSAPAAGAAPGAAAAGGANAGAAAAEFGTNPRLQEDQRRKESQASADAQELHARIKKVDPHPYGLHVLTLENGQVWQQKEKVWELELKPGDAVVIRRGLLGSYRLQLESKGPSASVVRVK